jgi:hypothetical protein
MGLSLHAGIVGQLIAAATLFVGECERHDEKVTVTCGLQLVKMC